MSKTVRSAFFSLLVLILSSSLFAANKQLWSEKGEGAKALVSLPSIQPIIDELDSTVVNISSTTQANQKDSESGDPDKPGNPFNSPEDFFEKFFGGPQHPMPRRSMGSGFIVSSDGYIVTNNHVVDGADKIEVRVSKSKGETNGENQETFVAKLIGRDSRTDVALLKIDAKTKLPFAYLGNSDRLEKGDWVVAMGNPFGLDHSVSIGIVSAKGREISNSENRRFDDFIQTDAAINFGNSGGPLVNVRGEVVGINTAITAQGSGIGFAIPINLVKEVIGELKANGKVTRGYLGVTIQDVSPEIQEALGLPMSKGVLVNDVVENGPAAKSALKPGDVITKVNGAPTDDARSLQREIGRSKPGETVNLEVYRDSKRIQLSVRLGSLDQSDQTADLNPSKEDFDRLGIIANEAPGQGVVIGKIDPNGVAAANGILPGDIVEAIRYRKKEYQIKSEKDYDKIVESLKAGESVMLKLKRSQPNADISIFIAFRVPKEK